MSTNVAPASISHPDPSTEVAGAKAIEVAAMLGDSVVDVKHCMDPHAGTISPKTWGLAAAGLSCVLLSAVAFASSVSNAAYNKSALDYWTHVAKKPAHAYRPKQLGYSYDWLAFGGFALGMGALTGALVRMRRERRSPYYRIGTAPGVEQPVEGAPTSEFPLVAPSGDDFVLNFGPGVHGEMVVDGRTLSLAELAANGRARPSSAVPSAFELPIPLGSRIRAQVGQTSFMVSGVARPREHTAPLLAGLESRTMGYFAGSAAVHMGIVLMLAQVPVDGGTAAIDIGSVEDVGVRSRSEMKEEIPPEQVEHETGMGDSEGTEARSMELEEGAAGTTKSNRPDGHMRIKNNNVDPQVARMQAIEEARTAGVLGSVALTSGDAFASLTATGNISSGFDETNVYGPIFGAEGEGHGYFGYGRKGFGGGGGCAQPPCGIIGTPNGYGKIGLSGKYGDGWGLPGSGGPGTRRHEARVPAPTIGTPTKVGDLDEAIIRRYIKRNTAKIAYCYEKQLLARPGIAGSVKVSFFITPNGTVATATGGGFDPEVANCVADVIQHIEFPKPQGGGGVQVNYPFTFRAGS